MAMTFAFLKSSAPVIRAPHTHLQVEQLGSQYREVMEEVVWIGSSFKFQPFDGFQGFLELANHHLGRVALQCFSRCLLVFDGCRSGGDGNDSSNDAGFLLLR